MDWMLRAKQKGVGPLITEPAPHDVLFFNGSRSFAKGHTGNMLFNNLINARITDYIKAKRHGKHAIIGTIVNEIRSIHGGRFLSMFHGNDVKGWYELDDEIVAEKVAQALRKGAFELKMLIRNGEEEHEEIAPVDSRPKDADNAYLGSLSVEVPPGGTERVGQSNDVIASLAQGKAHAQSTNAAPGFGVPNDLAVGANPTQGAAYNEILSASQRGKLPIQHHPGLPPGFAALQQQQYQPDLIGATPVSFQGIMQDLMPHMASHEAQLNRQMQLQLQEVQRQQQLQQFQQQQQLQEQQRQQQLQQQEQKLQLQLMKEAQQKLLIMSRPYNPY